MKLPPGTLLQIFLSSDERAILIIVYRRWNDQNEGQYYF